MHVAERCGYGCVLVESVEVGEGGHTRDDGETSSRHAASSATTLAT